MRPALSAPIMRLTPLLLWMSLIFGLSRQHTRPGPDPHPVTVSVPQVPGTSPPSQVDLFDVAGHFGLYAALAVLTWWALGLAPQLGAWRRAGLAIVVTLVFGVSDEWHQASVSGRTASLFDLMVDAAGALVAIVLVLVASRILDTDRMAIPSHAPKMPASRRSPVRRRRHIAHAGYDGHNEAGDDFPPHGHRGKTPMSNRVDVCPHCGRAAESDQEFCPDCGAWLVAPPAWPAPPPRMPASPAREGGFDDDAEPVPLIIPETPRLSVAVVATRIGLLLLTLALGTIWIWAERMIVTGDDWAYWDVTWVGAAVLTLLLTGWWLWDAVRRGRRDGWERAWRLWEPPRQSGPGTLRIG